LKGDIRDGKRGICLMGLMQEADIIEELLDPNILSLLTEAASRNS